MSLEERNQPSLPHPSPDIPVVEKPIRGSVASAFYFFVQILEVEMVHKDGRFWSLCWRSSTPTLC